MNKRLGGIVERNQGLGCDAASLTISGPSTSAGSSNNLAVFLNNHPLLDSPTTRTDHNASNTAIQRDDNNPPSNHPSAIGAQCLGPLDTTMDPNSTKAVEPSRRRRSSSSSESPFECPLCAEVGYDVRFFQRLQDLSRHFNNFHQDNRVWRCPQKACGFVSERKKSFQAHCKEAHPRASVNLQDAEAKLHPQLVFACGFLVCRCVYEAEDEQDAEDTASKYFRHILRRLDEDPKMEWKYSVRIRNLVRQKGLEPYWKPNKKAHPGLKLSPQPHNSLVLRKIIETRRWRDPALVVKWLYIIGSPPYNRPGSEAPPLPRNLSYRLEVEPPVNPSVDLTECHFEAPCSLPVDRPVSPITTSGARGSPSLHFSVVGLPVAQGDDAIVHQPYGIGSSYTDYVQYSSHPTYSHLEPGTFGDYQPTPSWTNIPPDRPSQYPSSPLEHHNGDSYEFSMSVYHNDMAIDPRFLISNGGPGANFPMNYGTEYRDAKGDQDYS